MPYITQPERGEFAAALAALPQLQNPGRLNFLITEIIRDYVDECGLRYTTLNDVVGALESAKAEFQRRVVAPYEDTKIAANGDVYTKEDA